MSSVISVLARSASVVAVKSVNESWPTMSLGVSGGETLAEPSADESANENHQQGMSQTCCVRLICISNLGNPCGCRSGFVCQSLYY